MSNKITVNWIRHSVSCNNIRPLWEFILRYRKSGDPNILQENVLANIFLRKHLPVAVKKGEYIFCSELKRSVQTAILLFPEHFLNHKIKIIPGINEKSFGLGNKKQKPDFLKSQLYKWMETCDNIPENKKLIVNYRPHHVERLFDLLDKNNHFESVTKNSEDEDTIIPLLHKFMKILGIKTVNIVSHGKYIQNVIMTPKDIKTYENYLGIKNRPFNNQIIQKKYNLQEDIITKTKTKPYRIGCTYSKKNQHIICFYNDKGYLKTMEQLSKKKIKKNKYIFTQKKNNKDYQKHCFTDFNSY